MDQAVPVAVNAVASADRPWLVLDYRHSGRDRDATTLLGAYATRAEAWAAVRAERTSWRQITTKHASIAIGGAGGTIGYWLRANTVTHRTVWLLRALPGTPYVRPLTPEEQRQRTPNPAPGGVA